MTFTTVALSLILLFVGIFLEFVVFIVLLCVCMFGIHINNGEVQGCNYATTLFVPRSKYHSFKFGHFLYIPSYYICRT